MFHAFREFYHHEFVAALSRPLVIWHTIKLHYKTANALRYIYSLPVSLPPFSPSTFTTVHCSIYHFDFPKKYSKREKIKKVKKIRKGKSSQEEKLVSGKPWERETDRKNKTGQNCRTENIERELPIRELSGISLLLSVLWYCTQLDHKVKSFFIMFSVVVILPGKWIFVLNSIKHTKWWKQKTKSVIPDKHTIMSGLLVRG